MGLGGPCLSVLGSTLFFFGGPANARSPRNPAAKQAITRITIRCRWMGRGHPSTESISAQQTAIVSLILHGKKDKGKSPARLCLLEQTHTVRTYLNRIFVRLGVSDRVSLVLRVVKSRDAGRPSHACPHKE